MNERPFMFKRLKFLIFLYVTGMFVLPACNTEDICNENTITTLKLGFYCRYYSNDRYLTKDSVISISELSLKGLDKYLVLDTVYKTSKLYLPLSGNADSSVFSILLDKYSDEYLVKYTRNRVFINYDCGFRTDFTIDTIISVDNRFDSVVISNPLVTDADDENIKIYFYRPVSGNN
jgi:hypothetical protein